MASEVTKTDEIFSFFWRGWFTSPIFNKCGCQTRIVYKGGLHITSFIYKYETSTTYPLNKTT